MSDSDDDIILEKELIEERPISKKSTKTPKPETISLIEHLSGVKEPDQDLDTPLLRAAKNKDFDLALKEINSIKQSGSGGKATHLLYAFFCGPLVAPTSKSGPYVQAYEQIKITATNLILSHHFGNETQPRKDPLSPMEIELLKAAEMSDVLGSKAQARAMAALSGVPFGTPRRDKEVFEVGNDVQQNYLTQTQEERVGKNRVSFKIARDSINGPVILSKGRVVLSDELPLSKYTLDKVVGHGVSGNVVLAIDEHHQPVVLKKIRLNGGLESTERTKSVDNVVEESSLQMFLSENTRGRKIVCDLREIIISGDAAYVVLEACDGTLSSKLEKSPLKMGDALAMLAEMADMFSIMHAFGITHRDIKTTNFLYKGDEILISDFGLSKSHRKPEEKKHEMKTSLLFEDDASEKHEEKLLITKKSKDGKTDQENYDPNMKASVADDGRKFALMILEELERMPGLSRQERSALGTFRNTFSIPQYNVCATYAPPEPNCFSRCLGATDEPTKFSRLVNVLGKMGTQADPKLMEKCAAELRDILNEDDCR